VLRAVIHGHWHENFVSTVSLAVKKTTKGQNTQRFSRKSRKDGVIGTFSHYYIDTLVYFLYNQCASAVKKKYRLNG